MLHFIQRSGSGPRILTRLSGWEGAGVVVLMLVGCATSAPVDQIKYFSQAFGAVNTVGQPLLDDLAVAERAQGQQIAARRARGESQQGAAACPMDKIRWQVAGGNAGFIRGFCLPDSGYFSDLGDPPSTAALRGGLLVVERYAGVLSTLAEGRNVASAVGQIDALGEQVSGLLNVVGVASGPLGAALTALHPILESAAKQANTAEARRLILEGAPKVGTLIGALRDAAPKVFDILIEQSAQKAVLLDQPAAISAEITRISAYRVAVANYVILLDRLQAAWNATVAAANAPPAQGRLSSLVAQTAELRADAETARRVFSVLRTGGPQPGTK